ncbi:hypothetical protein [Novispirillum itersonii]|uniref:hypothetical protein n=1 Tax=Novispirillum itersonii TaxID=189 RepID=UPI00036E4B17|nr:hypothetical protein [Novispirillum itersonii]
MSKSRSSSAKDPFAPRELVGLFESPAPLEACIHDLLDVGFDHDDLSLLSSHQAIEVAAPEGESWRDRLLPLLTETRYDVPLVAGTLIALATGPTGALIAGLAAAGVGAAALKEIVSEVVSHPDTGAFARAVSNGEIILWVSVDSPEGETAARGLLAQHGARNIHVHHGEE